MRVMIWLLSFSSLTFSCFAGSETKEDPSPMSQIQKPASKEPTQNSPEARAEEERDLQIQEPIESGADEEFS